MSEFTINVIQDPSTVIDVNNSNQAVSLNTVLNQPNSITIEDDINNVLLNPSVFYNGINIVYLTGVSGELLHNTFGDLQGGTGGQYYHLSSGQYFNLTTGSVVRPSETGNFITASQTGAFYASSNPSGFITGVDLSTYVTGQVVRPSETGNFITTSQTGQFYSAENPSGFITGVDLSGYVTGEVVRPTQTGDFITTSQTGSFYSSNNPSGFITGVDLSGYITGDVVRPSETGNFITTGQTGQFYATSNPSGFITGVDLSSYVTGDVVRPSDTGSFITTGQTGAFYPVTNPSGYITGVDLSSYVTGQVVRPSETGNFITTSQTGAFYSTSNPSGFITGVDLSGYVTGDVVRPSETGVFYTTDNPSGFITGIQNIVYTTGDQDISGLKDFQTRPTVIDVPVLLSGDAVDTIHLYGKNDEAFTLTKGSPVYINSANGANPLISLASNTGERTSSKTIGLMASDVIPNDFGYIITEGFLEGFDTSSGIAGDAMWLGPTGNIIYGTGNKPYGNNHLVSLGVVLRSNQNNGKVYVKVQNGFEIDELHRVYAKTPQNKDALLYDSTSGSWYARQMIVDDVSGAVPYSGATTGVDLGPHSLSAGDISASGDITANNLYAKNFKTIRNMVILGL